LTSIPSLWQASGSSHRKNNKVSRYLTGNRPNTEREQETEQVLYTDVMKVGKQPYLNTLIEPLQLFVQTGIAKESANVGIV
jgi:hypothetical protein